MSLYTTLWGGPSDGRTVRILEDTLEVEVIRDTILGDMQISETGEPERYLYVRDDSGIFRFAGLVF